ncbi:MAG: amidohydrolase, partial [Synergistaceae bacterium]|nr:amidohydrolase [Synergistaceae bacterium]
MGKNVEQTGKKDIAGFIEERNGVFTTLSDAIWDEPETAFAETNAASALSRALETFGFSVERGIGGLSTAFCGTFSTGGGPVVGFLGEYDALFNMSQKPGATKKEEIVSGGCGHGCGHNLLGVASLAAAAAVVEFMKKSGKGGTVKYFGCPGEEGGSGKAFMAKEGVFDGLDAAITWHPSPINSVVHLGTLANYQVLYKFKGVSAHAAGAPHLGRSALDAAELMNVGVNFLREHVPSDARFHYAITNSGGRSPNVVQAEAGVLYLIRAPKLEGVEDIYRRINKIAQGAAMMTETEVEIVFVKACANVIPNNAISECLYENLKAVGLPRYTEEELRLARGIRESLPHLSQDLETFSNLSGRALAEEIALLKDKVLCDKVVTYDPGLPER